MVFVSLSLASGICLALAGVRFLGSDQVAYFNLVWNLFLAWMPLAFAFFMALMPSSIVISGVVFMLFTAPPAAAATANPAAL